MLFSFVKTKGFISIKLASFSINNLYIDLISSIAWSLASYSNLKTSITFSQSKSEISFSTSILVVIIFSGFLFAISSISIPPSKQEINAIFDFALSTKHDK